jgi:hypothetical protein
LWQNRSLTRALANARDTIKKAGPIDDDIRREGRPLEDITRWRSAVQESDEPARGWLEAIDQRIVMVTDGSGARRYWLRDDGEAFLTENDVEGRVVKIRLLDAAPSMLTALGLIGTFIAIAVGLSGLVPDPKTETVQGVSQLVAGLSGKFVTSIVALGLSLILQFLDTASWRPLFERGRTELHAAIVAAFPTLSMAQQMAQLLESARKQERSLANISSDVVDRFSDAFSSDLLPKLSSLLATNLQTELGPSLQQVATSLASLEEGIRRLESGKQETISEELRNLTGSIGSSLRESLEQMGKEFRQAMSGSAGQEFENASKAMAESAEVLKGMNSSFESMQASLQRLLGDAEERARRSFDEGEGRTRALHDLVERLVTQLNDSASSSAAEIQTLLVDSVAGLGARFAAMSDEMERRVQAASAVAAAGSQAAIDHATAAARGSSEQAKEVLTRLGQRLEDFERAATQLRELREGVEHVLAETGVKVKAMQDAGASFKLIATEVTSLTRDMRATQDQQRITTEVASKAIVSVKDVVARQAEIADQSRLTFEQAQIVFSDIDTRLAAALRTIADQMQGYNSQVERNFEKIMQQVNAKMPELFDHLDRSLQQVADTVEELSETVGALRKARG